MTDHPSSAPPTDIPRPRKAAMVLQHLLQEGHDLPLASLSDEVQLRLTRELGALRLVDRETLRKVAEEFSRELGSVALTAPGSVEGALAALEGKLSPGATARLRDEAASRQDADPWAQVLGLEDDSLLRLLETESVEVGAVLLSKLPTARAAAMLGKLPGERARRIAYAVSRTATIQPDAVARIGLALARQYCGAGVPAFVQPPFQRVGAILNSSSAETRDRVLEGLSGEDTAFADSVRKAIFTFKDIPERLAAADVPKIVREVAAADLVAALASADAEGGPAQAAAEYILSNMSQRMADNLREEMSETGKLRKSVAEAAQAAVVAAVRNAADTGAISLITPEDED